MSITIEQAKIAYENGDSLYYAPQSMYEYLSWNGANCPGAPFKHSTSIPNGKISQIKNTLEYNLAAEEWEDNWIVSLNGQTFQLSRLFISLSAFKILSRSSMSSSSSYFKSNSSVNFLATAYSFSS